MVAMERREIKEDCAPQNQQTRLACCFPSGYSSRGSTPKGAIEMSKSEDEVVRKVGAGGQAQVALIRRHQGCGALEAKKRFFRRADYERERNSLIRLMEPVVKEQMGVSHVHRNNVVSLKGYSDSEMTIYMDMVRGLPLHKYLSKRRESIDVSLAIRLLLGLARGIEFCHSQRLVHGDIKTDNCMVRAPLDAPRASVDPSDVVLIDFGYSELFEISAMDGEDAPSVPKFLGVKTPGTPGYRAPELLRKYELGSKSDVYSFGITMWEGMTQGEISFSVPLLGRTANASTNLY